jgi:YD repeat-containing protein
LKTVTRTDDGNTSILVSYIDANGNVIKTIDSSGAVVSQTTYNYNSKGQLQSLITASADSNSTNESEQHIWEYQNNKPVRMLRIKNKLDTTFVNFKQDDKGNISEETETRRGVTSQPVYYYYNANSQLTDIVRYSNRAKRLLPEYMFEYSSTGQVIQKITVPENSTEYLIWRYQFDTRGLKIKEVIYNKQKQVTGKVEYQYSFGA